MVGERVEGEVGKGVGMGERGKLPVTIFGAIRPINYLISCHNHSKIIKGVAKWDTFHYLC